jgi:hypothetical protein
MVVACRLAGLSALETYYAGVRGRAQFLPDAISPCVPLTFDARAVRMLSPRP